MRPSPTTSGGYGRWYSYSSPEAERIKWLLKPIYSFLKQMYVEGYVCSPWDTLTNKRNQDTSILMFICNSIPSSPTGVWFLKSVAQELVRLEQ